MATDCAQLLGASALEEGARPQVVRAFFGLPVPEGQRAAVADFLTACAEAAPQFRWTPAGNLHDAFRSGGPPELRSRFGARGQEVRHRRTLPFGHRQPEKRPDYLRTGAFFQCRGTQELGAVGRHPKWVLTESMPSAMLLTPNMLISSGVMRGSFMITSIAVAPGIKSPGGTVSLGFLIPRPSRNQPKMVANVTTSGPPSSMILPSSSGFWIASTTHRAASSRRIGCSWTSPYAGMITNGLNLASRSKSSREPPSSPRISEKRRIVPATPLLASSCSPIHREVKYLKCGSSRAPMLLTSTTDLAPAALAASAMIRGPSTLTSRNDWGRFRRTATRLMMCSVPWAAWAMAAGLSASPTMSCAPRALKAAAFIGSRTSTLSWCPASSSLCATPRPKKPVEPNSKTLATVENRNGRHT